MCSFGVTNIPRSLLQANNFAKFRGPDGTTTQVIENIHFLHNLLSITGKPTSQPLYDKDIAVVFNGEIYNFKELGDFESEVEAILNLYYFEGIPAISQLDGEFAICIVDFNRNRLILATDTFATKPLWYDFHGGKFCVASYQSQLVGMGCKYPRRVQANRIVEHDLRTTECISSSKVTDFSTRQYKSSFDDWNEAFAASITKRVHEIRVPFAIGLSSGLDSGAIACELVKNGMTFRSYVIEESENPETLLKRTELLEDVVKIPFGLTRAMFYRILLLRRCELVGDENRFNYRVENDPGAIGLTAICDQANKQGYKVLLSGQGADELFSDYGHNGIKFLPYSSFGGNFPQNLDEIWPWPNVFGGTQAMFLAKEESVAGGFGLETRYPFLDVKVVQEFLHLKPELKNSRYKSVLENYLQENEFPFDPGTKIGFDPIQSLLPDINKTSGF